jgi:hypothetical protein
MTTPSFPKVNLVLHSQATLYVPFVFQSYITFELTESIDGSAFACYRTRVDSH